MTIALWCILAAGVLPYLFVGLTGVHQGRQGAVGEGLRQPGAVRQYLAGLEGWRRRARAGEANSHEAFAPFAAAVLVAQYVRAAQPWVDGLALGFIACRLVYGALYLADIPHPRSVVWFGGVGCVISACSSSPARPDAGSRPEVPAEHASTRSFHGRG